MICLIDTMVQKAWMIISIKKKPKHPNRKFSESDLNRLEKIAIEDKERVTRASEEWRAANQASQNTVNKKKEDRQVETIINKGKMGVRKIVGIYNRDIKTKINGNNMSVIRAEMYRGRYFIIKLK